MGRAGIARLTGLAIAEGTAALSGADVAEQLERLGGGLDISAGWDAIELALTTRASSAVEALSVLASLLRSPAFRDADVSRLRAERLAELVEQQAEPRGLADDAFNACVYQPASRLSLPAGGDTAHVASLTAADTREWHCRQVVPSATTVIAVGDLETDAIHEAVQHALGDWTAATPAPTQRTATAAESVPAIHLITRPGAEQSELRLGHEGPARLTPDYFDIVVMNAILGGLFSSRINLNLREQHGFTYGASTSFDWRVDGSTFEVSTAVRGNATIPAIREVMSEVERIRATPVTPEELSLAVDYLDGVFPIRYETTAAIAAALGALVTYNLPVDYFDTYRTHIRAVTAERVQQAARRYLNPARMRIALVGESALVSELTALGMGEVRVIEPGAVG